MAMAHDPRIIDDAPATLAALLDEAAARFGDRTAFVAGADRMSFSETGLQARALAAWLRADCGIEAGARVALMMPNCLAFPVAAIAVIRAGAVLVNVNPRYTARELLHQMTDAGAEAIIIDAEAFPALLPILDETEIRYVILAGHEDAFLPEWEQAATRAGATLCRLDGAIESGLTRDVTLPASTPDDIALLQYTGGTTGISKGAILRQRNIAINSAQIRAALTPLLRAGEECILTALPLYHIFAFTVNFVTFFSLGARNILIRQPGDFDAILAGFADGPVTAMTGVNTLYANIANHLASASIDWSAMRLAIGGGSAIMRATSERWRALTGIHILEGLGMTETSPVLTVNPWRHDEFTETVGLPLPLTEIVIRDDHGRIVEAGAVGEICVRGPQVMSGYWKHEDDVSCFDADGYLRTGDIGVIDEAGYLKVVDRKKDVIMVSGFNVFPNEVEAVASAYAGILECACVGVPHPRTGEAVKLCLTLAPGADFERDAFLTHCRRHLAAYKLPRIVEVVAALPKSPVGKILRRELRRLGAEGG